MSKRRRGRPPEDKVKIALSLDREVVEWCRQHKGLVKLSTFINHVLRRAITAIEEGRLELE